MIKAFTQIYLSAKTERNFELLIKAIEQSYGYAESLNSNILLEHRGERKLLML